MATPQLDNAPARALFLQHHHLHGPRQRRGKGQALLQLITDLGFVQVDSVNTFARAHDMILYSRCTDYRPESLRWLTDRSRGLFEGWTHDASVIPMEFYPYWQEKFARDADHLRQRYANWHGPEFQGELAGVCAHIDAHGACASRDVGDAPAQRSTGWWDWKPSKTALEYLWRSGELAVCHRKGFAKQYDLATRVIPDALQGVRPDTDAVVDWAAGAALDRLGFATSGELAAFFKLITPAEARAWCARALGAGIVTQVDIVGAGGKLRTVVMRPETLEQAHGMTAPGRRLRLLSPFDPVLRDRKRAEWLFGFHYRIEIFVPALQRQYGYYVFPILEGDRLIGRIDLQANRKESVLEVSALWPEPGVRFGQGRTERLMVELDRARRFAGCERLQIAQDFMRQSPVGT